MSSELRRQIERARHQVQVDWSPARTEAALRGIHRRHRWRRGVQAGAAVGSACALILLAHHVLSRRHLPPQVASRLVHERSTGVVQDSRVILPHGAIAVAPADTRVTVSEDGPHRTVLRLSGRRARFEIPASRRTAGADGEGVPMVRVFRVEFASIAIESSGTRFLLEAAASGARISVQEGDVRVRWDGQETVLSAGQSRLFSEVAAGPGRQPSGSNSALLEPPLRKAAGRGWKALAQEGHFDKAYGALGREQAEQVDHPGDLLLLSDVARLSHHPKDAVPPLTKLLRRHAQDPRAPLAAFTLGRILLDDLGRPKEAAAAFLRAQQLDPSGPMAEDALAREVEAWSRAGETTKSRERAEAYMARYPEGRRTRSVRRYGDLD